MASEILEWVPQEKRKQGRPKRGWRDDVKEATEARDRAEQDCCRREEWRLGAGNGDSCKIIRKDTHKK
jgi:hypothetical protein